MEPSITFDEVNERQTTFHRRAFVLGGFAAVAGTALVARLADLEVVEGRKYSLLSASNQFNFRLVLPSRGQILDRNGTVIASNRPDFSVMLMRGDIKDASAVLTKVSELIAIPDGKMTTILKDIVETPKGQPVAIANGLTWDEFSRLNVRSPELPGVSAEVGEARFYPLGGAFTHVLGYVAKINAEELKAEQEAHEGRPDPLILHPGFRIGKQGVEKAFDQDLRGAAGGRKVEVDSTGRIVRVLPDGDVKAVPGSDVVLTLDADIQSRALDVFGADSGAAVMMDCRTGDILCMVSAPSFDANQFVGGAPRNYYRALAEYDHKPLLNKALSGTYPPGSTFKTMVALTALENGFDPRTTHTCNGVFAFGNHVFHCDKHHGTLDLHGAIVTSCDVYFFQTALFCGPDPIANMARRFGLGEVFDIGIPGQKKGLVPDTAWKRAAFKNNPANQKWFPGETPSMGIGQGYTNINPLQSCTMVSRLANGKKAVVPRLVHSVGGRLLADPDSVPDLPVDQSHLEFVRKAMADVVTSGTGREAAKLGLDPIFMAGKTGTAQTHGYGGGHGAHGAQGAWLLRDHGWFVAFAPADDPRYAVSVIVEHGGMGGESAAPKAREIMKVALLKDPEVRKRIEVPLPAPTVATPEPTPPPSASSVV